MRTTTYTLKGNNGTHIVVSIDHHNNNAVDVDQRIHAVADTAPDFYVDALSIDEEFISARCFDGEMIEGETWALALEDDGTLTHEDMAFNPQYVEVFTVSVNEA